MSTYDSPFRKKYKPQFTWDVFENVAIAPRKPRTYTKKDEWDEIILGKFYKKSWSNSFNNTVVYIGTGFQGKTISRQYTQLLYDLFAGANKTGRSMGCCNFGIDPSVN